MTNFEGTALPLLYEDEFVRVLHKPSGLSVLKDNTPNPSLTDLYSQTFGEPPLFVHRLDKGTSGVLVLARTDSARSALSRSFAKGEVDKTYLALVSGVPKDPSGKVDLPLEKARKGRFRVAQYGGGLAAETRYRTLESDGEKSLLEIHPLSGRTHQIRVHLQALGHPLVLDPLYGRERAKPSLKPFLTLHSWKIGFTHPQSGEKIIVEAEPPEWASPYRKRSWNKECLSPDGVASSDSSDRSP